MIPNYEVAAEKPIPSWIENEARLINEALDKNKVTKQEAQEGLTEERELLDMMRKMVEITYYVEYPSDRVAPEKRGRTITDLFKQEFDDKDGTRKNLADFMAKNGQSVSLAMSTLDDETAAAIRYLNEKRIPVAGWVVVENDKGYWTNPGNIIETEKKTQDIRDWAATNKIELAALGFDLEKPLHYLQALSKLNVKQLVNEIRAYRARIKEQSKEGDPKERFAQLIEKLRNEGVKTETYTMPRGMKGLLGGMNFKDADKLSR